MMHITSQLEHNKTLARKITGGGYKSLENSKKAQFSYKRTRSVDKMSHCASFLCLNGLSRASFTHAEHLTAGDGTLELAEICCQQSRRTHTQTEIPSQQSTWTQIQPEILSQQSTWMQIQPEIPSQQPLWTHTQAEIPCQRLTRTQTQGEIVAAQCAAYRVFLRKTREGSWESTKTAIFIRFAYNRRRGRLEKIDIRSMA